MSKKSSISRRDFLKNTGLAAGAAALGGAALVVSPALAREQATHAQAHDGSAVAEGAPRGRMFFTNELEFMTLTEAAERIFPKDESGPGARELCVGYFIDNQLAGAYGYNAREYMTGPFAAGAPTQGPQSPLPRRDMFIQGLAALNSEALADHKMTFPELGDAEKDGILKKCEDGKIATDGFSSSAFFALLRSAVLAGVYSDPIYGGNKDMRGWKMKQYPGAQMSYEYMIEDKNFVNIAPMSLADMQ